MLFQVVILCTHFVAVFLFFAIIILDRQGVIEVAKEYTKKMRERKEALLKFFERKDYVPMKFKDIASLFQVPKAEAYTK